MSPDSSAKPEAKLAVVRILAKFVASQSANTAADEGSRQAPMAERITRDRAANAADDSAGRAGPTLATLTSVAMSMVVILTAVGLRRVGGRNRCNECGGGAENENELIHRLSSASWIVRLG